MKIFKKIKNIFINIWPLFIPFLILFGIIFYLVYNSYLKRVIVTPFDKIKINKCYYCNNFIIFKRNKYDDIGKCSDRCEEVNNFSNCMNRYERALIVKTTDPNYQLFKLKYDFLKSEGKNFDKFYKWYLQYSGQKFYRYVKTCTIIEDIPVYQIGSKSTYHTYGAYANTYTTKYYKEIIGYIKKPVIKKEITYKDPKDTGYVREECDVFEYYLNYVLTNKEMENE